MSTYIDKPQSLVERKKAQWAREREELASLSAPWGSVIDSSENLRTRHVGKVASAPDDFFLRRGSGRRQSLPPIYRKGYVQDVGGETSGYGSDNPNLTPDFHQWNQGYESSSSARDDRPKWGDRGVGVGKFWDPQEMCSKMDDTPGWVKRGLQGETEVIVASSSPAESPEQQDYDQRSYTSSSMSQTRTFIRGQNHPIDPVELAERERKRQLARAHQEAIKQQLEERERRRHEERERRLREEREEELRIQRDQDIERQRREREQQALMEKHERERRRKEALQEAIQLAEKEAQEQKVKNRMTKQVNLNINENVQEKEKVIMPRIIGPIPEEESKNNLTKVKNAEVDDASKAEKQTIPNNVSYISNPTSSTASTNKETLEKKENNVNRNRAPPEESAQVSSPRSAAPPPSRTQESVMVLPAPYDTFPPVPFAILMPTFTPGSATPLPLAVSMQLNNPVDQTPRQRTENRILTPTQYRNRHFCDSSTQTEAPPSKTETDQDIKDLREKLVNMDVGYETKSKREGRSRTGESHRDSSEKPKWGANRPPTRYIKQSEKDPFYQRKKRQKARQGKGYDDKNNNYSQHSSDDSQTASPRTHRKKGYIEKRRTRALWQKSQQVFTRNLQVYQTEIVPLDSDKNHIFYKKPECIKCCCDCRSDKHRYVDQLKVVDILKIEHSPRDEVQYENSDSCLPQCNSSSVDSEILEKLNSLHNGLVLKQEQWQNTPCTPTLHSPRAGTNIWYFPKMAKLDDFLGKKKEAAPILDLSKATVNSKEDFKRLLEKVPDFKMKAEKIRAEDVKIRDKDFKFKTGKKDLKVLKEPYTFQDPSPPEMKNLKIEDLISVPIDWKMLTTVRPKSKADEDFFSRIIELGKQELRTRASDKRAIALDPQIRKTKNKAGVVEMRVVSCKECGEDFCNGKACTKFSFDNFARIPDTVAAAPTKLMSTTDASKDRKIFKKKKIKRKPRSKSRSKRTRGKSKSKSPKKDKSKQ